MTSCYSPYPPLNDQPAPDPTVAPVTKEKNTVTAGDRAQQQLDAARARLKAEERKQALEEANSDINGIGSNALTPATPTTYKYATKVEGKDGFVHNPFTQNQVDVRGIPSGTLVRDPHDANPAHKFRVP